jgi:competence protein ComEC
MPDPAGNSASMLGPLARRPALPLVLLLIAGIILHPLIALHQWVLICISLAITALAVVFMRRRFLCTPLLSIAVILCGVGLARREHYLFAANQIGLFTDDDARLCDVELRVDDPPQLINPTFGQMRPLPPKQSVMTDVLRVKTTTGWILAKGQMPIVIDQPIAQLQSGQIIRAVGMLQRPAPAMNPGQFDWAVYYRQQRVLATLTVTRAGNIAIVGNAGVPCITWLRLKTRELLARGFVPKHATDQALLAAMLLGDRDPKIRDIQNEFEQTGVAYQLSVSGLHVALLTMFVHWLCRLFCLRPRYSLLISGIFLLLYAIVSLPTYSGVRAVIFLSAIYLSMHTRRWSDRLQLLSLAVFAMLLCRPMDLYSSGFQLSVVAVAAITLFLPRVREFLLARRDPHKVAAAGLVQPSRLQMVVSFIRAQALRSLQFILISWLATLPLIACQFDQFDPWSLLAGLVLLPVVFGALVGGLLKILLTLALPFASGMWAFVAMLPVIFIRWIVDHLAQLPGAMLPLTAPPPWLMTTYYALLIIPLLRTIPLFDGRRRWLVRLAPLAGVSGIFLLPFAPRLQHPGDPAGNLRITLLSLGAGQCAVIEPPGEQPILFDAGSSSMSDLMHKVVGPFLRYDGRREVDEIFLSHGDYDHISAAGEIAAAYASHAVFISPHFRRNAEGNVPDQMLLETLEKLNLPPRLIARGDHLDLGNGTRVDVLWPPRISDFNSNNTGLVLRLTYAGRTILFPADIQNPAFEGVLQHASELRADVLVAAHHGSSESLTPEFLRAVDPAIIVSSNAWRLSSKQKRFDGMVGNTPLYRTSKFGAITITVSKEGKISIATFLHGGHPPG